jgi:hypothetical protein
VTAEVAVMNNVGVALAADSAVTLGLEEPKIWTSADKLFLLSESGPVGIMVFGNARFMNIPWETIVKVYRQHRKDSFETLKEYYKDFLTFLEGSRQLFPAELQKSLVQSFAMEFFGYVRHRIEGLLETEFQERKLTEEDIEDIASSFISEEYDEVGTTPSLDGLPDDFAVEIRDRYTTQIRAAKKQAFGDFPLSQEADHKLLEVFPILLCQKRFGAYSSGVVIAGFGEGEHFPSLIQAKVNGIVADRVLHCQENDLSVGVDGGAFIIPFAQKEMVHTFMEGIDPGLVRLTVDSTVELLQGITRTIVDEVQASDPEFGADIEGRIGSALDEIVKEFVQKWTVARKELYVAPVMAIVEALPKDELAAMAESLVNLTKFKRRVSSQQETVGGPIDVAVITKGDGFVWIKRKHYFKPELNHRFLAKYYLGRR